MTSKSKTAKAVGTKRLAAGAKSDASKTLTVAAPAAPGDVKRWHEGGGGHWPSEPLGRRKHR
jgi:hypothetical protein